MSEWISVKARLPEAGERVLVSSGMFVGEAYRTSANTWYRHTGFPLRDILHRDVTHWMPLPEPPEED